MYNRNVFCKLWESILVIFTALISHPGECVFGCSVFLGALKGAWTKNSRGELRRSLKETSSNQIEEGGPSCEVEINCGASYPGCGGWKMWSHRFMRQKSNKGWSGIKTFILAFQVLSLKLHRLVEYPRKGNRVLVVFMLFEVCPWPLLETGPWAK